MSTSADRTWGQIAVTADHVSTPVGTFPMIGTRWTAEEAWESWRDRPAWALVLGMLTFWTVVGAAFFFVTNTRHWGQVTITMHAANGAWWRETLQVDVPAERARLIQDVMLLDNWSLAAERQLHP